MERAARIDRHWGRAVALTVTLALLVGLAARPGDPAFALVLFGTAAAGFGFFYLLFPGGLHFAVALANGLAVYATLFGFLTEANFPAVRAWLAYLCFILPVAAFLASTWIQRAHLARIVGSGRLREAGRFPRLACRLLPVLGVGAASFIVPDLRVGQAGEEALLLGSTLLVTVVVAVVTRDIVAFLLDASLLFEEFFARVRRLMLAAFAFLTLYSLLVIVFACVYRLLDWVSAEPLLAFAGERRAMSFGEALYFSVVTLSTIGYGDVVPVANAARVIASLETVTGVLLLLFGFAEIMRASRAREGR